LTFWNIALAAFEHNGLGRPGTKPDVCENGFPRFRTQILGLQV